MRKTEARLRSDPRVERIERDRGKTIVLLREGFFLGEHGYATFGEWTVGELRRTMARVNRDPCPCAACSPTAALKGANIP